jgi:hypothetical protein
LYFGRFAGDFVLGHRHPERVIEIPISNREYDTYRKTVKVPKGRDHGQTEGHATRKATRQQPQEGGGAAVGETPG